MSKKRKYYAVRNTNQIFENWSDCERVVKGTKGVEFKSFRYLRGIHKYQIIYLAVDENYNLVITTTHSGYQAWIPISVIYSEFFPHQGTLRRRMDKLANRYLSEFNQLLSEVSPLELNIYSSNLNRVILKFDYM